MRGTVRVERGSIYIPEVLKKKMIDLEDPEFQSARRHAAVAESRGDAARAEVGGAQSPARERGGRHRVRRLAAVVGSEHQAGRLAGRDTGAAESGRGAAAGARGNAQRRSRELPAEPGRSLHPADVRRAERNAAILRIQRI